MSITSSQPQLKPRRRRWLRYTLVSLGFLLIALAASYAYMAWSFETDFKAAVAETDALDPRWRLEDIEADRKVYRPEDNAALQTIAIAKLLGRKSVSAHPNYADLFDRYPSQHQLNGLQMEMIRQTFAQIEDARIEARKLKDMPGGRFAITYSPDFISTVMPNQQNARQSMELLHHDAMFRAQNGDAAGAMESCLALLGAGGALGDEPLLISYLIHLAGVNLTVSSIERTLAQGFPAVPLLEEMQRRVAQERADARAHWTQSMRGERAGHHRLADVLAKGKMPLSSLLGMAGGGNDFMGRFQDQFPMAFTRSYPDHLRHLNDAVEATKLPVEKQKERFKELEDRIRTMGTFSRLLAPALARITLAHLRAQASLAATEAALACERFRIETKRWPESLDELVKAKKLDAVAIDPFDGQPLRLRKLADGLAIYSVSIDKQDNHGNIERERTEEVGTDLGVRVWDPARRRQPPLPPGRNGMEP